MRDRARGGLVYSTDDGRMCPACRRPIAACACAAKRAVAPSSAGIVRVSRETRGRGGKTVTLVRGVDLEADALAALGKRLRSACGAGGTLRDGVIEIQGEHRERIVALLAAQGFSVKRAEG